MQLSGLKVRIVPAPEDLKTLPDVGLLARPDLIEKNPRMIAGVARAVGPRAMEIWAEVMDGLAGPRKKI